MNKDTEERPRTLPARRANVGTISFTCLTIAGAYELIQSSVRSDSPSTFYFSNAYCVALAENDERYRALLNQSSATFPDGLPVWWFLRKKNTDAMRVRGPSTFENFAIGAAGQGMRQFFFGSSPETIEELAGLMKKVDGGARFAGALSPSYSSDPTELVNQIPDWVTPETVDIVWVGLGSPKQDYVCELIAKRVGVTSAGVGAAFDFMAGTTKQAPKWMQSVGLEWFFRLLSEPRRLWRRYLLGNATFLRAAVRTQGD